MQSGSGRAVNGESEGTRCGKKVSWNRRAKPPGHLLAHALQRLDGRRVHLHRRRHPAVEAALRRRRRPRSVRRRGAGAGARLAAVADEAGLPPAVGAQRAHRGQAGPDPREDTARPRHSLRRRLLAQAAARGRARRWLSSRPGARLVRPPTRIKISASLQSQHGTGCA